MSDPKFEEVPWETTTPGSTPALVLNMDPTVSIHRFIVAMAETATAGTFKIVLPRDPELVIGRRCELSGTVVPPGVAGIVVEVRQDDANGELLFTFTLDSTRMPFGFSVVYSSTQRQWIQHHGHYNGLP